MSKPELSDPITLRLPVDVLTQVTEIAATCERTRSWVMVRALRQYLGAEGADILAVARGMKQVEAGDVYDMDDVLREAEAIIRGKVA